MIPLSWPLNTLMQLTLLLWVVMIIWRLFNLFSQSDRLYIRSSLTPTLSQCLSISMREAPLPSGFISTLIIQVVLNSSSGFGHGTHQQQTCGSVLGCWLQGTSSALTSRMLFWKSPRERLRLRSGSICRWVWLRQWWLAWLILHTTGRSIVRRVCLLSLLPA